MKQNETVPAKIQLKAYSLREMAELYEVSERTFKNWLNPFQKDIGMKNGRYFTPKQIKVIFDKLGLPDTIFLN
jgi:transposase